MKKEFNYKHNLILNPVENLPFLFSNNDNSQLEGLYISDKVRNEQQKISASILFSGREDLSYEINLIYQKWAKLLHADALSMRLLSGLHAHIVTFMGIGNIGDSVLLLPTIAGGHYATKAILERLGYNIIDMVVDFHNYCVDQVGTLKIIEKYNPKFIFVDRSEGINYEDFTNIATNSSACTIYDASQYLTNILIDSFKSPFEMGFDFILSTLHKNFPGPQKALICTKDKNNIYWGKILDGMSSYVSSLHAENIFKAGDAINNLSILNQYADLSIQNSILLEKYLDENGVPVIRKNPNVPATHHIWIPLKEQDSAFNAYKKMEQFHLLVNYRLLPYKLGYGLRLGTTAATMQGLKPDHTKFLARVIADILQDNAKITPKYMEDFISELTPLI
ncbi:MAG: hypothetical protein NC489_37975 [Ruminococcus flavefaciens]|nr:hypothetical protein [Ruminococcus flavefaciens]